MGRVADFFLLTVLWAVFSLPVITIGASTAALYDVALRMAENREGYLFSSFVKAFKVNLKQALVIEGILLAAGMLIGANLFFLFREKTQMSGMLFWMFLVLAALLLFSAGGIAFLHAKVLVWMIFPKYNWNESKEEQLWQC